MRKKEEFSYFEQFIKSAELAKQAVTALKKHVDNFSEGVAQAEKRKIHELENQADNSLHELKTYLLKDFMPPIDREDIIAIAHKIDDVVDAIDEVAINLDVLLITEISENMKQLVEMLEGTVSTTYDLVVLMKNIKNQKEIKEKVVEVNKLEEQADRKYEKSMFELHKDEKDPIQIIKWIRMYGRLEDCFDACENVADCIEEVLLKNS